MSTDSNPEKSANEPDAAAHGVIEPLNISTIHEGRLAGKTFVAKDLFDVAGYVTGAGNPDWKRTHQPAARNAPVIDLLLTGGATLIGKSCSDELAYSLDGDNVHYGTPINATAPDRLPGGSSSGSASAVSAGVCDFGLGTDTSGSIRVPSSYCGLFGFRASHGKLPMQGVVPLAPSYDTIGWMTREAALLQKIGKVLLEELPGSHGRLKLKVLSDAWSLADPPIRQELPKVAGEIRSKFWTMEEATLSQFALVRWSAAYRILQAAEVWKCHGDWITQNKPAFGPEIEDRFVFASTVSESQVRDATAVLAAARAEMNKVLDDFTALLLPTTWNVAPLLDSTPEQRGTYRANNFKLTCFATILGAPQANFPILRGDNVYFGVSLVMPKNRDMDLLALVEELAPSLVPQVL